MIIDCHGHYTTHRMNGAIRALERGLKACGREAKSAGVGSH
jgi:hypothetical protein